MAARPLRSWIKGFCFLALAWGCNSPTLPLPPPAPPDIESVTLLNEQAVIRGGNYSVEPYATVLCTNKANSKFGDTEAGAQGSFVVSVQAQAGNTVECMQMVDNRTSDPASVVVPSSN